jgi:dTDP-4-amino-4,6-dideoxygalactose transaminase
MEHVWHLFVIRSSKRENLQKFMNDRGIQTLIHYPIPPHKQGAYKEFNSLKFPITEQIHEEVLSLPLSGVISFKEIESVVKTINSYA